MLIMRHFTFALRELETLGLYGAALLRERGFTKVFVSDVNQDRLLMVPRFGGIPLNTGKQIRIKLDKIVVW